MQPSWIRFLLQASILVTVTKWVAADGQQVQESNVIGDGNRDWDKILVGKNWTEKMNVLRQRRAMAIKNKVGSRRWPNGIIYYAIDPNDFTPEEETSILAAMEEYTKHSCLQFKNQFAPNMIKIQGGTWCHSHTGMLGGTQVLELTEGCRGMNRILHELGHAIGLIHEHQRPDRDSYVTINLKNVKQGRSDQFTKYQPYQVEDLDIPFDYQSIMMYEAHAFSKNDLDTIVPKTPGKILGQTSIDEFVQLTYKDVEAVNLMYPCDDKCNSQGVYSYMCTWGFLGKDCNCWCEPKLAGVVYDECEIDIFG